MCHTCQVWHIYSPPPIISLLHFRSTFLKLRTDKLIKLFNIILEKKNQMKKLLILLIIVLGCIPAYSGCWKWNSYKKIIWTGGVDPDYFPKPAAYGDSTLIYLDKFPSTDTITKNTYSGAVLWRTKDAGSTFHPMAGYVHNDPVYEADSIRDGRQGRSLTYTNKIVLLDENRIYLAGESEILHVSTDGGKTWDIRRVFPSGAAVGLNWRTFNDFDTHASGLGAFCFKNVRVPIDQPKKLRDTIAITTDDWKTAKWVNISKIDTELQATRVCIADSNTIYVGGFIIGGAYPAIICKSNDKGLTWTNITFPDMPNFEIFAIDFINKDTGWVAGVDCITLFSQGYCTIYKTIDGGKTWELQYHTNNNTYGFTFLRFTDALNGWALGTSSGGTLTDSTSDIVLFHTIDGGKTWTRELTDQNGYNLGIAFGMAVGSAKNANIFLGWHLFQYVDDCTSGVEETLPPMPEELNSFPNPIASNRSGRLLLGDTYGESLEGVYLYDSRGSNISNYISYELSGEGELNFNLNPGLASGAYMITVVFGINRVKYCKVVVE